MNDVLFEISNDVLFEISRWIRHPLDVISFGKVSRLALSLVHLRMRLFKCMDELKNLFRYTPRGFIHKRRIIIQFNNCDTDAWFCFGEGTWDIDRKKIKDVSYMSSGYNFYVQNARKSRDVA